MDKYNEYYINKEIIEIYCEYIKAKYYDYQCRYDNIHKYDDIAKVIYLIHKKMKSDSNFNRFYEKYKQDLEDSDPNILKIKLDVPEEDIDVLVLAKIFKALNTINEEIAKLIGIPKSNLVFKLKNIKKGCIEINFIHGVIGSATTVIMTPIIRGLIGRKNLELLENNTELLKEAVINFITSKTMKNSSWVTSKLRKAEIDLYRAFDSIENLKVTKIMNNRKSKTIQKNNIIDYYI